MTRPKIDDHPERERIEFDLALGKSVRTTAAKYGVSKSACHRLLQRLPPHIRAANLAALLAPDMDLDALRTEESRGLIAIVASQRARLHLIQDRAMASGDDALAIKAAAAIHRGVELLGEFLGQFVSKTESTSISIICSPAYAKLRNVITRVLQKHPLALADFTHAMQALEADEIQSMTVRALPPPVTIEPEGKHG
jgi:hypothetical protein